MTTEKNAFLSLSKESQPIHFPQGLIGLEEWQQFVLISHPIGDPLRLLQSIEDERISFIVIDPSLVIDDYQVSLSISDAKVLQLPHQERLLRLNGQQWADSHLSLHCILSIQESPLFVTVNLLGPLVINHQTHVGRQIILSDGSYNSRHVLTQMLTSDSTQPVPSTNTEGIGI